MYHIKLCKVLLLVLFPQENTNKCELELQVVLYCNCSTIEILHIVNLINYIQ